MNGNFALPTFSTQQANGKADLWPPCPVGLTYNDANALGRERGTEMVALMRRTGAPALLGHVIEAILGRGAIGGAEIGFFHVLSLEIMEQQPRVTEFIGVSEEAQILPFTRKLGHMKLLATDSNG